MNCKPGDLAIIVAAHFPQNNGKLVRVIEDWAGRAFYDGALFKDFGDMKVWLIESLGSPLYAEQSPSKRVRISMRGPCADSSLRPLRPGDTADSDETMKEKEAA